MSIAMQQACLGLLANLFVLGLLRWQWQTQVRSSWVLDGLNFWCATIRWVFRNVSYRSVGVLCSVGVHK